MPRLLRVNFNTNRPYDVRSPIYRIPLYQRLLHALCLTLVPFVISRVVNYLFSQIGIIQDETISIPQFKQYSLNVPQSLPQLPQLQDFESGSTLMEKFIHILVNELGCEQDWWFTRLAGALLFVFYASAATLAISFSALFHSFCLAFIMWKKWNSIRNFVAQFWRGEFANLGVL